MTATEARLATALALLETRVSELERKLEVLPEVERRLRGSCAVCRVDGVHGNCFNCCRDLCAKHMAEGDCPHSNCGHEPRR